MVKISSPNNNQLELPFAGVFNSQRTLSRTILWSISHYWMWWLESWVCACCNWSPTKSTSFMCIYNRIFIFFQHLVNGLQAKSTNDVNLCINKIRTVKEDISALRSNEVPQNCMAEYRCTNADPNNVSQEM